MAISKERRLQKFWDKVKKTESCWLWLGTRSHDGYGQCWVNNECHSAQKGAWLLLVGPIPEGLQVCHNCPGGDNRLCVNPAHLFLGTRKQNSEDMVKKGRSLKGDKNPSRINPALRPRGEKHGNAVLNDNIVRRARSLYFEEGQSIAEIARHFLVGYHAIYDAVARRTRRGWSHV